MPYRRMNQEQAQRLHRGDLVYLYGNNDDIFQVDLTPRRGALLGKIRLHSYRSGIVNAKYDTIAVDGRLAERLQKRTPADFSNFAAYFVRDWLTQPEQIAIYDYLVRLCLRTGHLWKPGGCRNIPGYIEEANDELGLSSANGILTKLIPKMFNHGHFFWSSTKADELFIIDPIGVPDDDRNREENISPFFGLLENSTGFHKFVYENMKDMDDWGIRDLPPGFHP